MAYPSDITQQVTKINKNASGWYIPAEYFNVPAASPFDMYLDHVPKDASTTTVGASGGAAYTQVDALTASNQYIIDVTTGKVTFHSSNANAAIGADYYNLGDDIMAEHVNTLQSEILNTQTELGTNAAGSTYDTVALRLGAIEVAAVASGINGNSITDNTIRAGALRDDIKGATWSVTRDVLTDISSHVNDVSSAHIGAAIDTIAPGSVTATTVQQHVFLTGNEIQTDTNPHGLSIYDIGPGVLNGDFGALIIAGQRILASGNVVPIDGAGAASSGSYDVGSIADPWASGNFDTVQAANFKTGNSGGVTGNFTTNDGKAISVVNGLIVSIL